MEKKGFFRHGFLLEGLLGLEGRAEGGEVLGVPVAAWLAGAMAASAQQAVW